VGRFHLNFGRQNLLHMHELPTVESSFVNRSFLGDEALADNGVSIGYSLETRLGRLGVVGEAVSGEGGGDETPVLNNNAMNGRPAFNTHLSLTRPLANDWDFEIGGSWLNGRHDSDDNLAANLFGVDLSLSRRDGGARVVDQLLLAELIFGNVETAGATQQAVGVYLLGQQRFARDWYAGARLDWTQDALDETRETWGVSPFVTWHCTKFLRLRAQYQHKAGDVPAENSLYFQATLTLGSAREHSH
jgi:hypothetical protein